MDCKHEKIYIGWKVNQILCRKCARSYKDDEVMILTKAQHKLRKDAIETGRTVAKLAKHIEGCVIFDSSFKFPITPHEALQIQYDSERIMEDIGKFALTIKALDAYKGE